MSLSAVQGRCLLPALLAACCLLCGCAGTWAMKTENASGLIYWPPRAGNAKVQHLATITGFRESGTSASSLLRGIIIGQNDDNDIKMPVAVSAGNDGRLAIADTECRCVHLFIPAEEKYLKIVSAGSSPVESPVGVVFDEELNLYVSDSVSGRVSVFGRDGSYISSITNAGEAQLKRPTGLAYNRSLGMLYVADTLAHTVYGLDRKGSLKLAMGSRGSSSGLLNYPTYIFTDPGSRVHVIDSMNFRVQTFSADGTYSGGFGHHGDGSGDFSMPKGIAVDRDGIVYVADSLFDNLQIFGKDGEFLLTVGSRGNGHGEFWMPSGIFIDEKGTLYVCDTFNQRIQTFRVFSGYAGR